MSEKLAEFIQKVRNIQDVYSYDEASTCQMIIQPIFLYLGWNIFEREEVYPQFPIEGKRVDFALRLNNINKVFIEVKKPKEELDDHEKQLISYTYNYGVKLACLTNGITWRLYLPLNEGRWNERRFFTIHLKDQTLNEVTENLLSFLSKENVKSEKALENAHSYLKNLKKNYIVKNAIPSAWEKLISEPDELMVELLADKTEDLCGYRPEYEVIENFLKELRFQSVDKVDEEEINTEVQARISKSKKTKNATQKIIGYTLFNKKHNVSTYIEMLLSVCKLLYELHKDEYSKILSLRGKKWVFFSKNPEDLKIRPIRIEGTPYWVEANFSADSIKNRLVIPLLLLFGHKEKDISFIETN